MGKRLFVGSLPYDTTESQLQELFAACGAVESVKIIIDKMTGQSKGFGFVEMGSDTDAAAAIEKMNNSTLGSRRIVVNEARPMEKRPGGFGGGGGGGFGGGFGGGGGRGGGGGGGGGGDRPNFGPDKRSGHGSGKGGKGKGRGKDRDYDKW